MMMKAGTFPVPPTPRKPIAYVGMRTPWGKADSVRLRNSEVAEVSTPGHGGFKLSRGLNARVHEAWRKAGGWYEEDCEWAIVALTLGADAGFSPDQVEDSRATCKNYFPNEYFQVFGVEVKPEESYQVRQRMAKEAAKGKMQIIACWGDWAVGVPIGMVGVCATLDGDSLAPGKHFLVTEAQYNALTGHVRVLPEACIPVEGDRPFHAK